MSNSVGGFQDGPDVPVPRLVLWKLVTRSARLEECERHDSAVLVEKERELLSQALADLRAVVAERGLLT